MSKSLATPTKKKAKDFTLRFKVGQSPEAVFAAIQNVRGWWSKDLEGKSAKKGDEFIFRYPKLHYSKQRLIEVVPGRRMVWRVLDAKLTFTQDQGEWKGTEVVFEVIPRGGKTELLFTHRGLTPAFECFDACSKGWDYYIRGSLRGLIETGEGTPGGKKEWKKAGRGE